MEFLILVLGILLLLAGLAGSFLPVLPGPPLAWLGIMLVHLFTPYTFTEDFLWLSGFLMLGITIADYLLPGYLVKFGKGSKKAVVGANVGVLVGLFMAPVGILLGPFFGAWIGEMMAGRPAYEALRPAFFAFLGFLCGVFLKFVFALWLIVKLFMILF